ncbi:MAG: GTPase HflX, partial [candidate division Zixibacteria bacterium]|nr:GTPase HflX [candidate division Zixibacteria bacterium]
MINNYDNTKLEKIILVGLAASSRQKAAVSESLDELAALAKSARAKVVGRRIQVRPRPTPAFYVGKGLVAELKRMLEELGGNCVLFDDMLSPAQQRNLEQSLEAKVLDRPILILDIFANRA